jgi:hypothetical protein
MKKLLYIGIAVLLLVVMVAPASAQSSKRAIEHAVFDSIRVEILRVDTVKAFFQDTIYFPDPVKFTGVAGIWNADSLGNITADSFMTKQQIDSVAFALISDSLVALLGRANTWSGTNNYTGVLSLRGIVFADTVATIVTDSLTNYSNTVQVVSFISDTITDLLSRSNTWTSTNNYTSTLSLRGIAFSDTVATIVTDSLTNYSNTTQVNQLISDSVFTKTDSSQTSALITDSLTNYSNTTQMRTEISDSIQTMPDSSEVRSMISDSIIVQPDSVKVRSMISDSVALRLLALAFGDSLNNAHFPTSVWKFINDVWLGDGVFKVDESDSSVAIITTSAIPLTIEGYAITGGSNINSGSVQLGRTAAAAQGYISFIGSTVDMEFCNTRTDGNGDFYWMGGSGQAELSRLKGDTTWIHLGDFTANTSGTVASFDSIYTTRGISAENFLDRSNGFEGDALTLLSGMRLEEGTVDENGIGKIDHTTIGHIAVPQVRPMYRDKKTNKEFIKFDLDKEVNELLEPNISYQIVYLFGDSTIIADTLEVREFKEKGKTTKWKTKQEFIDSRFEAFQEPYLARNIASQMSVNSRGIVQLLARVEDLEAENQALWDELRELKSIINEIRKKK